MNRHAASELNRVFSAHWQDPALECNELVLSYAQLYATGQVIAEWLAKKGVKPGSKVALRLSNGWPFAVSYVGCLIGNYRVVPVNPELSGADQTYILQRVQPAFVIEQEAAIRDLPSIEVDQPQFSYPDQETAFVFFTSGTTGRPKGVCHSLNALVQNVKEFNQQFGLDAATRLYHVLPMAYMAGFLNTLLSPWLAGGTVLLGPRFQPSHALSFWQQPLAWQANTLWLTPTLAALLARLSRDEQIAHQVGKTMQQIFCGTAPLPDAIRHSFLKTFSCPLQESYGTSEILLIAAQTREQALHSIGVGQLLPSVNVKSTISAEHNAEELLFQVPWALQAYLLEEGESSPLTASGAFPSGDQGSLEAGMLCISGRLKDLIIRGGLNVSPVAIEDVLLKCDGVKEAAVVGLPHPLWGESIVAVLVAEPGTDCDAVLAVLQTQCIQTLAEGMRPDQYTWVEALPKSSTGKIQKHELRRTLA